jgi:hypothetical protein
MHALIHSRRKFSISKNRANPLEFLLEHGHEFIGQRTVVMLATFMPLK